MVERAAAFSSGGGGIRAIYNTATGNSLVGRANSCAYTYSSSSVTLDGLWKRLLFHHYGVARADAYLATAARVNIS